MMGLLRTSEEDRMVDVPERVYPPVRHRRRGNPGCVGNGYGASSRPHASS